MDIEARVAELNPWITQLNVQGRTLGGTYQAAGDDRLWMFIERLKAEGVGPGASLLECGCLEGGHTVALAREFPEGRVVGSEVREENLRRSRLHAELAGVANVEFVQADLEEPGPVFERRYDAIFCVGLLYHLRDPAAFLRRCAKASSRIWIWTVICAEDESTLIEGGARGRLYGEPTAHVLSAVREQSMFPTLGSLCDMLWDAGYTSIELVRKEMTKNGNGPAIMLYAKQAPRP